jgi:uridine kinase
VDLLAGRILALRRPHPVRVAIDGIDGAGKTTLANRLAEALAGCGRAIIRASVDGFHHPRAYRYRRGRLSPRGCYYDTFDYARLRACLLEPLGPGGDRRYCLQAFDYRTDRAVPPVWQRAPADAILILDGVFLLRPELRDSWDYSVFLDVPFPVALERLCRLHNHASPGHPVQEIRRLAARRYFPAQRLYFRLARPHHRADVVA